MSTAHSESLAFNPRARLLRLLGDELIRDPNIAIFELVKNAYDADASTAKVSMLDIEDRRKGRIIVDDDGIGMDWATVTGVWMEPGTDYRVKQRANEDGRSPKYRRLPLGEKGVGRFAAGKLGDVVKLTTRAKNQPEIIIQIDWNQLLKYEYMSDAHITVTARKPKVFTRERTGTRIEISSLRDDWTRGMARNAHRSIASICSPFGDPGDFNPALRLEPDHGWLDGLLDPKTVIEQALFRASGTIHGVKNQGNFLTYEYQFMPPPGMNRVEERRVTEKEYKLPVTREEIKLPVTWDEVEGCSRILSIADHEIGTISFELFIFDLDRHTLSFAVGDRRGFRQFLNQNGGVRVYRDGIRVYNYGEPGDDWLDLGGRRVNVPTRRLSNNLVLGGFSLDLKDSFDLVEKTNREGFVENRPYRLFRDAVMTAVGRITTKRNQDKIRIRNAYAKPRESLVEAIEELREGLQRRGLSDELGPYVDSVEREYIAVRETLLTAAGSGLSLTVVIHEVEKGIQQLNKAVDRDDSVSRVRELAKHLSELVDGLTYLTRRSGRRVERAGDLVRQALFNTEYRLKYHQIRVVNGFQSGDRDFRFRCTRRLVIATLMNLIDNAIYWLDQKGGSDKCLYIGPCLDLPDGSAIVVADSGPGFRDSPDFLVEPFVSTKPDGMGLGLHLASEVMKVHDGRTYFPESGELDLPSFLTGAVVALVFKEA